MQAYDAFYKRLIESLPLKNVTSRFAMEKVKSTTALPLPTAPFTPVLVAASGK
jgi:Lrp/AsnC family transcriptional regulator